MKRNYVASMNLPKGFPVLEYEHLGEILGELGFSLPERAAEELKAHPASARITDVINNYLHQKGALVDGRDDLLTYAENVFSFPMKTKEVRRTIDGKETTVTVAAEKDSQYWERLTEAVVNKSITLPGIQITGTTPEQREAQLWAALQNIVEKPVTITVEGKEVKLFDLRNDIKVPERKTKARELPEYATAGAASIIAHGTQAKWAKTFTEKGIQFDDFMQKVPAGATPEQRAEIEKSNALNLARAIVANEAYDRAKKYA